MSYQKYLLIAASVSLISICLKRTCRFYSSWQNNKRLHTKILNTLDSSGSEIAGTLLEREKVFGVSIKHDSNVDAASYKPKEGNKGTIHLPTIIYEEKSIYAMAISAHECGHVLQHHEKRSCSFLIRSAFVLFVSSIGATFLFSHLFIILAGFSGIITVTSLLLNEKDASKRGLEILKLHKLLKPEQESLVQQCLDASFLSYRCFAWGTATIWSITLFCVSLSLR